jgi:hypothetical protein
MLHITLQMNRTAVVVHKLLGKTNDQALNEQVKQIVNVSVTPSASSG